MEKKEEFHLLFLELKKNKVTIREQEIFFDLKELCEKLKKDIPIILSFTGRKIVSKVVSNENNYLQKILFNKDPDGYYIQEFTKDANILVSIARKEDVDLYLNKFADSGLFVLDFSIGAFVLESISSFLSDQKIIITSDFQYNFTNSHLTIRDTEVPVELSDLSIGNDKISGTHIVAFAGYMCYLTPAGCIKNYEHYINKQAEMFSYKLGFSILAKGILILFLILLSFSYFIRSYYSGKSAEIQQETALNIQVLDEIAILKKDRDYKQNVIANSSLGSKNLLSFYISQITTELPGDILLERLVVFPAKSTNNPNDKIIIEPNTITVNGITASKVSVNQWVELLDNYEWIKKVELLSYTFEKNEYVFQLKITL